MKPLIVLLIAFCISLIALKLFSQHYDIALSARIAMAVMLIFTSIAHFAFNKGMAMMVPSFIPYKTVMVYLTGISEIAAAVGLLITVYKTFTGWFLIVFFLLMLPANIYAALNKVDYQKATYNGNSVAYLWFRIPLQLLFIVWVYISAILY